MLNWQMIESAAKRARFTEDPFDQELIDAAKKSLGADVNTLEQYLEKAGPFIGPRGGKWADPKHRIPWDQDKHGPKKQGDKIQPGDKKRENDRISRHVYDSMSSSDLNHRDPRFLPEDFDALAAKEFASMVEEGEVSYEGKPELATYAKDRLGRVLAKWILDKEANRAEHGAKGEDLTPKGEQRLLKLVPGARRKLKMEKATSTVSIPDTLEQYLEKAMPTCEPKQNQGHGEASPNGADLDQTGKMTGSGDSESGLTSRGLEGAKPEKKDKLSEDDEEVETTPKPHKKPIEAKKAFDDMRYPYNSNTRRQEVAMANAAVARRMADPHDVVVGVGVATPAPEPQPLTKATVTRYGDLGTRTNATDLAVERYLDKDQFYLGGAPTLGPQPSPLRKARGCSSCGGAIPMALHGCPHCGSGVAAQLFIRGEDVVIKSTEAHTPLRLRTTEDVKIG